MGTNDHRRSLSGHLPSNGDEDVDLQHAIHLSLQETGSNDSGYIRLGYVSYRLQMRLLTLQLHSCFSRFESDHRSSTTEGNLDDKNCPAVKITIDASRRESDALIASAPQSHALALPIMTGYGLLLHESDSILKFCQAVEWIDSQGRFDFSGNPDLKTLSRKAGGAMQKLAMMLDDTKQKHSAFSCR